MRQLKQKEDSRMKLLRALFVKSRDLGIGADQLRDEIAPEVIGKRLSAANAPEIGKVLDHITKPVPFGRLRAGSPPVRPEPVEGLKVPGFKYPSTKHGLMRELEDVARVRWGIDYKRPLNKFLNANRKVETHYGFANVSTMKAVKDRIVALNKKEGL
jgi:hypothetical protein